MRRTTQLALAAGLLLAWAARVPAQEAVELQLVQIDLRAKRGGRDHIRVEVRTNLPASTRIVFRVDFEGQPLAGLWGATYLDRSGERPAEIWIPLERALLPGDYRLTLRVDPRQQNPAQQAFWSAIPAPIERGYDQRIGDAAEEAELRAELRADLLELVRPVAELVDEVSLAEREYQEGKRFRQGGRFDRPAFVAWAKSVLARVEAVQQHYDGKPPSPYGTYYAKAYRETLPAIWLDARLAFVDYTIVPILEAEEVEVPPEFERLEIPMALPRAEALRLLQASLEDLRRIVGESPMGPGLASFVPPAEEMPPGWSVGTAPADLAGLLTSNPRGWDPLDPGGAAALARWAGEVVALPGMEVQALAFALVQAPGADGAPRWVLAVALRFPGASIPAIPAPAGRGEMPAETTGASAVDHGGAILAAGDTVVAIHAAGDDSSRRASEWLRGRLTERFGLRLVKEASR